MVRGQHGGYEAEISTLPPQQSLWGQLLRAAVPQITDQPLPLPTRGYGFGGTIGGIFVVNAGSAPLVTEPDYFGDLPTSQQPEVDTFSPWERV